MNIALFQPDIPQNAGAAIRLSACMGVGLHVIEPCGFVWDERKLQAVALDYIDHAAITRHRSFAAFERWRAGLTPKKRLVLLSTKASLSYADFEFRADDVLLLGRESSGVTPDVLEACEARIKIPLVSQARSLNVVLAAAMVLSEGLRQTGQFPKAAA